MLDFKPKRQRTQVYEIDVDAVDDLPEEPTATQQATYDAAVKRRDKQQGLRDLLSGFALYWDPPGDKVQAEIRERMVSKKTISIREDDNWNRKFLADHVVGWDATPEQLEQIAPEWLDAEEIRDANDGADLVSFSAESLAGLCLHVPMFARDATARVCAEMLAHVNKRRAVRGNV